MSQEKICKVCGKAFIASNNLLKKGFGIYCSRACQHKTYPKRIVKYCLECEKRIEVHPSKQKLVKFCSKKCRDDFMRDYVSLICVGCKNTFRLPRSDVNRGRGSFCTWKCFKKYEGETSIEKMIRQCLERFHIEFEQEVKIGKYRADFLIPKLKLVIECDGEYWHSREYSEKRDKGKDQYLKSKGYKVFRFPEEKIRKSAYQCLSVIFNFSYAASLA